MYNQVMTGTAQINHYFGIFRDKKKRRIYAALLSNSVIKSG